MDKDAENTHPPDASLLDFVFDPFSFGSMFSDENY